MNMISKPGDTCLADMHTPYSMYGPSMVSLGYMVMEKLTQSHTVAAKKQYLSHTLDDFRWRRDKIKQHRL